MADYVRFVRGNDLAFEALSPQSINRDTLYFITYYERDENDPTKYKRDDNNELIPIKTALYLGNGLVSDSSGILSESAQAFLDNIPTTDELIDGDLQVWVGEQSETTTDPETGDPVTTTTPAHWETRSIDDLVPVFQGAIQGSNGSPNVAGSKGLVPAPGANDYNKFLRGDGTWFDLNAEVVQDVITSVIGDGNFDENLDTLLEIATWIQDHPSDASEMNARIIALEQAIGATQETIITPVTDENGDPVYIQIVDDNENPLYWNFDETIDQVPLEQLTEDQPVIPVFVENPEGEEPPYVQATDNNNNLLYWNLTDEPSLETDTISEEELEEGQVIYPVFLQDTEETPVPNDIEVLKQTVATQGNSLSNLTATVGTVNTLLGYSDNQDNTGKTLTVIDGLNTRLSRIENLILDNNGDISFVVPDVGNLDNLLLKTEPTDEEDPADIVAAINVLDRRTRWQELSLPENNDNNNVGG